ncbi:MAG: hypothetical protein ACLTYW_05505 [Collinsella sp.]
MAADSELDKTLDSTLFVPFTADARAHLRPIRFRADIANVNRCVGTILGNAVTKAHPEGLPAGSITIDCDGSAGQSFGAFLPRGITLNVCGDANDYFGKGLSGGEVSVRPNPHATYKFDENIIVGNVAFFGARVAAASLTAWPASALRTQLRCHGGGRGLRQPWLRVHDGRSGAHPGRGRAELRRRHDGAWLRL